MKKILACLLSTLIFLGSYVNTSAAQLSQLENETTLTSYNKVDQTAFLTLKPGDVRFDGFSVSYIEHSFVAHRDINGSVIVTVDETFNSARGYYEFLATDLTGEYFIPSRNIYFYTYSQDTYEMYLSADTVSLDGYVYLKFAIAPVDGAGDLYAEQYYKIPIDYNGYYTANNNYELLEPGIEFTSTYSNQSAAFDAKATKLDDNSVEILINISNTKNGLWFKHNATSKDGELFMPQRDHTYCVTTGPQTYGQYRFMLPENSISNDGYIYLEVQFKSSYGMISVNYIKLPIMNT